MGISPFITVAVDGGAASGKSSTSRALSARFNLMHVDTGSHYRTVTLALMQAGVSPEDSAAVETRLQAVPLGTVLEGRTARLAINSDVPADAKLRTPEINALVSPFAALPAVRRFLFDYQRSLAALARAHGFDGLIMEGRDIGSVIMPDADLRLFLEADPAARAARRVAEGGVDSIARRDQIDASRATAPLVCPPGAVRIDSTHLSLDEVVEKVAVLLEQLRAAKPTVTNS
ncbi:MAG: (d)CMP kinase [Puniceicoccales bacterium]|jgi:cytidylate kinase|nr:(d)CMP kinase [Puniceicoccales bacterium]